MTMTSLGGLTTEAPNWATATLRDIQVSLGDIHNLQVGHFLGRSEYFTAEASDDTPLFIKTIIQKFANDDSERRFEGEHLANTITIASSSSVSPLTASRVIQSNTFPGDYYIVSRLQDESDPLQVGSGFLSISELEDIGHFVHLMGTSTVPKRFRKRRAGDTIPSLLHFLRPDSTEPWKNVSNGARQVASIIRWEADLLRSLADELGKLPSVPVFSHGDLKFSQFLKHSKTNHFMLCDWEECGISTHLNDLSSLSADLFYSLIREIVDDNIGHTSDTNSIQTLYDESIKKAERAVSHILSGYVGARRYPFSKEELRAIQIRIGLMGLLRLYSASINTAEARPRELALASIGMQIATNEISDAFFAHQEEHR